MLPRQRRRELAGIEVGEIQHLHLGEAECLLHPRAHHHSAHRMHHAAHHRRRLDLHARAAAASHQPRDRPCTLARRGLHLQLPRAGAQHICQSPEGFGNQLRILGVVVDRQPGQIYVHRQARQVVLEEVDGRAALERKARLLREHRQDIDQQPHPVGVAPIPMVRPGAHRGLPAG
ncbi:hypothetical protein D3C81_1070030 [compost metagenome]